MNVLNSKHVKHTLDTALVLFFQQLLRLLLQSGCMCVWHSCWVPIPIVSLLTCSMLRTGLEMSGPLPLMTSNSMPIAGRGVRMSEKKITPSVWNAL